MRRKDREVSSLKEKLDILDECLICRIGMIQGDKAYIVPMNFGYEYVNDMLTLYFHSAGEGRKISMLSENPSVCFEMDCGHEIITADLACGYSIRYKSLIGEGVVSFITDRHEKIHALDMIMEKVARRTGFSYDDRMLDRTCLFKITVTSFTAKKLK